MIAYGTPESALNFNILEFNKGLNLQYKYNAKLEHYSLCPLCYLNLKPNVDLFLLHFSYAVQS